MAVLYCIVTAIVLRRYDSTPGAFTGQIASNVGCYLEHGKREPSSEPNANTYDLATSFSSLIWWGYRIHLLGFVANSLFAIRVYYRELNKYFDIASIGLVTLYSLMWIVWLLSLIMTRFSNMGRICSGAHLPADKKQEAVAGYAV